MHPDPGAVELAATPGAEGTVRWRMEFYNERRGILARYDVDARLPAEAVRLGWKAVLAQYPASRTLVRGLFARAQRVEGQHASGWLLHRIASDGRRRS
jgi:hypothetical protein